MLKAIAAFNASAATFRARLKMKYAIALIFMSVVGCEDRYRYPCQDPDNFGKSECNPPACIADGTCTEYVLKRK